MRRALIKWYYRRQFKKALKILNSLAERHKDAGHEMHYKVTNASDLHVLCYNCPEMQPLKRKPEDVKRITVDHLGKAYK